MIFGLGYEDSLLSRHPTKADLDRVSTTVPEAIVHISGHFRVMNSAALTKAGISAASADPVGHRGSPSIPDTAIVAAAIAKAYDNNWLIKVHANGDAAIDQLLDAVGQVTAQKGVKQGQVILIHGQFLRPDQIPRLKALGIFPSMFPMHTFYWGDRYEKIIGPERAAESSPMCSILDAGMIATSHSDAPVALGAPLVFVASAPIARHDPVLAMWSWLPALVVFPLANRLGRVAERRIDGETKGFSHEHMP